MALMLQKNEGYFQVQGLNPLKKILIHAENQLKTILYSIDYPWIYSISERISWLTDGSINWNFW